MNIKYIYRIVLLLIYICTVNPMNAQVKLANDILKEVDFNDTTQIHSRVFSDKIIGYLYDYSCCDESTFDSLSIIATGNILEKAKVNMRMYEYLIVYMLDGYSSMGKSKVVDYLLNYPKLLEGEISMEEGLRLDSITAPYQRVKVGEKAPDFTFISIKDKPYHLYESKAKQIIVFFWSTDCEYCHDFLVQMRKNLNLRSDYELVTFALAANQKEVKKAVKKMRLPGYHFYDDSRWEGKAFLDYHVTSTPTVFLLDADKTIVCKPYDWEDLKCWLSQNRLSN